MKHKLSIIYAWIIRTLLYFMPNIPLIMRFRGLLYSLMLKSCGRNLQIASDVYFNSLSGISIGNNVYIAPGNTIIGLDIEIGDDVLIGPNTLISGGNHQFDGKSFRFTKSTVSKVVISNGCWIGGNCSILAGAILPSKSILAAGAVLNKAFSSEYGIYAGVPARYLKSHNI